MNDNKIVYKLTKGDDGFIGSVDELERCFDSNLKYGLANAFYRNGRYHGYNVERVGVYKKLYEVYKNGYHVFTGTVDEVAEYLCTSPNHVVTVAKRGITTFKEYKINQRGREFVAC